MISQKNCKYCNTIYTKDTEHVFPKSLGGQKLCMNCVCENCNEYFSGLEGELSKSIVALMRSNEGLKGYKNYDNNKPAPFKAPILLVFDEQNNIVFEVGQFYQMQIFLRPQIIFIEGKYYVEGNTNEAVEKFVKKFKDLKDSNLKIVTKYPKGINDTITFIEFTDLGTHYSLSQKQDNIKIKDHIQYCSLPKSHELYSSLTPRIFIDDDKNLKVRAKTIDEAISFMESFLNCTLTQKEFHSFENKNINSSPIYVGLNFDSLKAERALVKIGINCLMYYYPKNKSESILDDYISFVKIGSPLIRATLDRNDNIIDTHGKTHNIIFYQNANSVKITIGLFNGLIEFSFTIENLHILNHNECNKLHINYKDHINNFENNCI